MDGKHLNEFNQIDQCRVNSRLILLISSEGSPYFHTLTVALKPCLKGY